MSDGRSAEARAGPYADGRGRRAAVARGPPDQPGRAHDGPEGPDRGRVREIDPGARLLPSPARAAPAASDHGGADGRAGAASGPHRGHSDSGTRELVTGATLRRDR